MVIRTADGLMRIKARPSLRRDDTGSGDFPMPADAVPFIAAMVAAFAFFMIALGAASLWARNTDDK
jgi:hypothetical protein